MVRLSRLLKDYSDAGAINTLIALWGFVDESTFLTKAGHVGLVYRLRGFDAEGLTHGQRLTAVHQFESALRALDEHWRVYQYVLKQQTAPFEPPQARRRVAADALAQRAAYLNGRREHLFDIEHVLVLLYEPENQRRRSTALRGLGNHPVQAVREWLSPSRTVALLQTELDRAVATLHHRASTLEVQLSELGIHRLPRADAFRFFRRLANCDRATAEHAPLVYDTHLDYFVADSPVECHRDHLLVGRHAVKVLSMKEPPARTFAHMLGDLLAIPGAFIACLEWQRSRPERVRRDIQARRRHYFNKRVSLINYVSSDARPEEMLVDDSAGAMVHQLGEALTEIEVNGHAFGLCSLTIALSHEDRRTLQTAVADAQKVLASHDGSMFEETYNLLNAWLSLFPGNGACNLRRLAVLETNLADLSFLFTHDAGIRRDADGREALAVFETSVHTPYAYHLHVDDVGHTLVLGATGSGKSFLLNFLVTHLQQYDPLTVVLDLGHSYRKLATLLDGAYLELGIHEQAVTLNPFDLVAPTLQQLHFLHAFTRVLLEGEDGYRLSDREDREAYEAVENLFVLDQSQRRLFTLGNLLPRPLGVRLHKWVGNGRYAALFDHPRDTLTMERLQVFDMEAMRAYPSLLEPLLFYVLHRVSERVLDPAEAATVKVCVMDEAWRLIQHPTLRSYVQEALKTWRKRNASMILATQSLEDFASADLLRTVVESCPTRLLLANPSLDRQHYADLLQMNERELDLLTHLLPRQQVLLKRAHLAKVLTLQVDPRSYWIYTNSPQDNARVDAALRTHGFEGGLDRLSASA